MNRSVLMLALVILVVMDLFVGGLGQARAGILDTVDWKADTSVDGTGTGTFNGTNTITYTTAIGFNAGVTYPNLGWASDLGTSGATGGSVTYDNGGSLGGAVGGTTQTIAFSQSISQPVLLVNYLGGAGNRYDGSSFDFGANSFALLSSHNAVVTGNIISATSAVTDSANDGFGIRFNGTYGPSNPLVFSYSITIPTVDGLGTVSFTLGTPEPTAIPEPASLTLFGLGAAGLVAYLLRERKRERARFDPRGTKRGHNEYCQVLCL